MLSPIVLFVYNRPLHTLKTLEALRENELADQSKLFIYADGPKSNISDAEEKKILEVRSIIKSRKWCKEINIIESEHNKGLSKSIISGVTDVVNDHGKVIVLEDDLLTSKYFLTYMNNGLKVYEKEERVASISGYSFPINMNKNFFIKGSQVWGWATWNRAWQLFEPNGEKLLEEVQRKKLSFRFDRSGTEPYTQMLEDQIKGLNDSWGIRWHASTFLKNKLTLYPSKSLITNFGFDGTGVHCTQVSNPRGSISVMPVAVEAIKIRESREAVWKLIIAGKKHRYREIIKKLQRFPKRK